MVIGRIRFLASTIAPKPEEIEYWIDLSEDRYGCVIKCYNGVEWERIDQRTYDEIISFKHKLDELLIEIQECENNLLQHKEDFEEYKNETNSSLNTINEQIENINASLETLLGESASEFIDKYNEILNFLTGYEDTDTLQSILSDLKNKISQNITEIESNLTSHINNKNNPHNVTKQQVGLSNVTNDAQVKRSEIGTANGIATLNEQGLIPSNQLPSYVDDVIDCYATYSKEEDGTLSNIKLYSDAEHQNIITGESGKIYVDITGSDSAYQFRWTGTQFTVVGAPTVIGEVTGTAFDGARGKALEDKVNRQQTEIDNKQDQLVSGTNIKTINGNNIIGSGNLQIEAGSGGGVGWYGEGSNSEVFNDPDNISKGDYSHSEGHTNIVSGDYSHVEGTANKVIGTSSHSEGWSNINFGNNSHTEGARNMANGGQAHAEGYITIADGNQAHTEGQGTETELTINIESVSDNTFTCDNDFNINDILYFKEDNVIYLVTKATSEKITTVNKLVTISSGQKTVYKRTAGAIADNSHSEGLNTKSIGNQSHSEGNGTIASGNSSHTEGTNTIASGLNTHAEGNNTISSGENSHVEGNNSKAIGMHTHAEGDSTQAIANCSHTGGTGSIAEGYASFAHGNGVKTKNNSEIALGKFNVVNEGNDSTKQSLYSVGCGTGDDSRYNALMITQSGDMYIKDIGNYEGNEQFNYEDGEIAEAESLQRVMSNVTGKLNQLDLMKQSYIYYIKYSLLNQEMMDKDSFLELYNAAKEGRPGYIDYETNHTKEPCSITISNADGNYMVRVIEKRQLWSGNNKEFRETTYNINGGTVLGSSDATISRTYKPFVLYKSGTGTKYLNDEGNYSIPFSYQILTQSQYDGLSSKDSNTIYFIKE